jgi:hypothetical protein
LQILIQLRDDWAGTALGVRRGWTGSLAGIAVAKEPVLRRVGGRKFLVPNGVTAFGKFCSSLAEQGWRIFGISQIGDESTTGRPASLKSL